jgi:hypothetical protein
MRLERLPLSLRKLHSWLTFIAGCTILRLDEYFHLRTNMVRRVNFFARSGALISLMLLAWHDTPMQIFVAFGSGLSLGVIIRSIELVTEGI